MPEIDPVILQIKADNDAYLRNLRATTRTAEQQLGLQEKRVKSLERQMERSSGAIGASFKRLAGAFAAGLSAREVQQLADSYTRFTNQLAVAGLEGENLVEVQERLFQVAQRNGVQTEAIGTLYSRAAQSASELGASQEQLINFTEAVAASLRISGTSATEAQGALLQLGQALGAPRVQAEEFNSLLDTMQPLLREVAKEIDGTGGTIGGLTRKIKDLQGPGVSNVELFNAINAALGRLEETAGKSTLTIGNSFTTLNNALGKYIGETDDALSATERLSQGIESLANNIDTVIVGLTGVAAFLGVRYVAGATAATAATVAKSAADVRAALTAQALSAATAQSSIYMTSNAAAANAAAASVSRLAVAQGVAARAASGLVTLLGGPYVIALTALAGAFIYLSSKSESASEKLDRVRNSANEAEARVSSLEETLRNAGVELDDIGESAKTASGEMSGLAQSILGPIQRFRDLAESAELARLAMNSTRLKEIENERRGLTGPRTDLGGGYTQVDTGPSNFGGYSIRRNDNSREVAARQTIAELDGEKQRLERENRLIAEALARGLRPLSDPPSGTPPPAPAPTPSRTSSTKSTSSGPDPAEIQRRFQDELEGYYSRIAGSLESTAVSAEREAQLRLEQVRFAEEQTLRSIAADDDLSNEQKALLSAAAKASANAERDVVRFEERARLENEAQDLAEERFQAEQDALRLQFDLATTDADRRDIALRILDAEDDYLRAKLEATIANQDLAKIERERAEIALKALNQTAGARKDVTNRQFAGPLERYAENAGDVDARVEEATARQIRHMNDTIVDAISSELGVKDPFLRELFSIFLDENIFGPLAEALSSQQGGTGGLFSAIGTALGSLFGGGRASGGAVTAGKFYEVGERGRELFAPGVSGTIIPNQALANSGGASGVVRVVIEEGPGFAARVRTEAEGVAIEVQRQTAPAVIEAAANETIRRSQRRRL